MLFVQVQTSQFFGSTWENSPLSANMGEGYLCDSHFWIIAQRTGFHTLLPTLPLESQALVGLNDLVWILTPRLV